MDSLKCISTGSWAILGLATSGGEVSPLKLWILKFVLTYHIKLLVLLNFGKLQCELALT